MGCHWDMLATIAAQLDGSIAPPLVVSHCIPIHYAPYE